MAVLYLRESPQMDLKMYDRISSQVRSEGMPAGLIHHYACEGDKGGLVVVEIWESEEAQDKWSEELNKKITAAGAPPRPTPRKMTVHNEMSPGKAQT